MSPAVCSTPSYLFEILKDFGGTGIGQLSAYPLVEQPVVLVIPTQSPEFIFEYLAPICRYNFEILHVVK
jgi:hypothetical protein